MKRSLVRLFVRAALACLGEKHAPFEHVSEFDHCRIVVYTDCRLSFREIVYRVEHSQMTVITGTTDRYVRLQPLRLTTPIHHCRRRLADSAHARMWRTDASETISQRTQSVTKQLMSARSISCRLQYGGMSGIHPLLRLPLILNH